MTSEEQRALQGMSDAEIRKAQALVRAQQPLAYVTKNTKALEQLSQWEEAYAAELYRRHFT